MTPEAIGAIVAGPGIAVWGIISGRRQRNAAVKATAASTEEAMTKAAETAVNTMKTVLDAMTTSRLASEKELLSRISIMEQTLIISREHFTKCESDLTACLKKVEVQQEQIKGLETVLATMRGDGK